MVLQDIWVQMHRRITYIGHTFKEIFAFFQKGKTDQITLFEYFIQTDI